jgi:zinc transporter ZupT
MKRVVLLRVVMPIAAALAAALALGLVYPRLFPEWARRPNDPVGYWLGTAGIPCVWVVCYTIGGWLCRGAGDQKPPL